MSMETVQPTTSTATTSAAPGAVPSVRQLNERARFDMLTGRIFGEMGRDAARWRLTWIFPFHVLVVALLIARGESGARAIVQVIAVAVIGVLFSIRVFRDGPILQRVSFFLGKGAYFTLVATTGGLCSPLLVTGAVMVVAAAFTMREPPGLRAVSVAAFLCGMCILAMLSTTTWLGHLEAPLQPVNGWPTAEYVVLALASVVMMIMGVHHVSNRMTRGYERAALELAERREELCSENEDRSRELEGMVARLAHEVKNPLAAIKGLSTHMARSAKDPQTAERLAIVAGEADRLQSIVDSFLSFSRGLDDLKLGPTEPFAVARELAVLLEARAQEAEVTLEVGGDARLALDADARKLRQVLLNIVLNAVQASPRGATVRVSVERDGACGAMGDGARITVRDAGAGMTPEILERIRKPYFTTKEGGTGLGLAVARGLVEQHGGRLEISSQPGKGTSVAIVLPPKATPCSMLPKLRAAMTKVDPCGCDEPAAAASPAAPSTAPRRA